jgi:hypothetical protein
MPEITGFSKVAPYLVNPLVLIGFGLFLFFGLYRALLLRYRPLMPIRITMGAVPELRELSNLWQRNRLPEAQPMPTAPIFDLPD